MIVEIRHRGRELRFWSCPPRQPSWRTSSFNDAREKKIPVCLLAHGASVHCQRKNSQGRGAFFLCLEWLIYQKAASQPISDIHLGDIVEYRGQW